MENTPNRKLEYTIIDIVKQVHILGVPDKEKFTLYKKIGLRTEKIKLVLKKHLQIEKLSERTTVLKTDVYKFKALVAKQTAEIILELLLEKDESIANTFFIKGIDLFAQASSKNLSRKLGVLDDIVKKALNTIRDESEVLVSADISDEYNLGHQTILKTQNNLFLHNWEQLYLGGDSSALILVSHKRAIELMEKLQVEKTW